MSKRVTDQNVDQVLSSLREYYRRNFRNGESDESFFLWVEGQISPCVDPVISALRGYYRRNFRNGKSDTSFLLWVEDQQTKDAA